jgi:hypothetical protein
MLKASHFQAEPELSHRREPQPGHRG